MNNVLRSPNRPPGDFRIWIDGSYKDGVIGYGAVIMPGYHTLSGGSSGSGPKEAALLAVEKALEAVPEAANCIVYTDYKPLIRLLNKNDDRKRERPLTTQVITAMYNNTSDAHQMEAHQLAEKGREKASVTRRLLG